MVKYYLVSLDTDVLFNEEDFKKDSLNVWVNLSIGLEGKKVIRSFTLRLISYEVLLNDINNSGGYYIRNAVVVEEFSLKEVQKHIEFVIDKCNLNKSEDDIFNCLKENFELNEY